LIKAVLRKVERAYVLLGIPQKLTFKIKNKIKQDKRGGYYGNG